MAVIAQPQAKPLAGRPSLTLGFVARLFREKPLGAAGGVIFVLFLLIGIFADLIAPYGANHINPISRLKPPSWSFPFGTDNLGRDMFSRCVYGAQLSVIIGFCAAGLATVISVFLGIITGYIGGKIDLVIQRFVDAWRASRTLSS
jgi:peptide/nickel transport system permease protein